MTLPTAEPDPPRRGRRDARPTCWPAPPRPRASGRDRVAPTEATHHGARRADFGPILVLLDINLPGDTGWSVLRSDAFAAAGRPPVVVASAMSVSPARLREFGVAGYLPKPFALDTLRSTIDRLLAEASDGPMTDLQILLIAIGCVIAFAGYLALCERLADERPRAPDRRWPLPSSSSTCCGRCCALRTSDRARHRPPDPRRARGGGHPHHAVPRALHHRGHGGRADHPESRPPAGRAGDLPRRRHRRDRRAGLEGLRRRPCWSMAVVAIVVGLRRCCASRTSCR